MKKYKVYWSIFNLFGDSQAEVVKLQQIFKGLTATVTGATWYASNANNAIYVGVVGFFVDLLISCFYFENVEKKQDPDSNSQV